MKTSVKIVYYAPREQKYLAFGSGDNYMWSGTFFICSRGAYTIFLPREAENTTFAIGRREQKWHFRPTRQKSQFLFI